MLGKLFPSAYQQKQHPQQTCMQKHFIVFPKLNISGNFHPIKGEIKTQYVANLVLCDRDNPWVK